MDTCVSSLIRIFTCFNTSYEYGVHVTPNHFVKTANPAASTPWRTSPRYLGSSKRLMPILRLLPPSRLPPACLSRLLPPILRQLHNSGGGGDPPSPDLSLLEELFPEEVQKKRNRFSAKELQHIPRLPLSTLTDETHECPNVLRGGKQLEAFVERDSLRQWNISVLVIRRASRSLIESDFRRVAPKGQHIDDWKGLGDILRVIPARETTTLQQHSHYYLLFPNPAYARAYQSHIISLHRIAKTHTPTSIESPLGPPPGMLIEGENIHDVLQNYALCPPSQRISLRVLFPPYSPAMRRLIDQRGYAQIEIPLASGINQEQQRNSKSRSGRAVLVWVQGYNPPLSSIREMINQDGRTRGLPWSLAGDVPAIEKVNYSSDDATTTHPNAPPESGQSKERLRCRWIVTFVDESEARRFIRRWHRRPFPLRGAGTGVGEPPSLVNAEFIW